MVDHMPVQTSFRLLHAEPGQNGHGTSSPMSRQTSPGLSSIRNRDTSLWRMPPLPSSALGALPASLASWDLAPCALSPGLRVGLGPPAPCVGTRPPTRGDQAPPPPARRDPVHGGGGGGGSGWVGGWEGGAGGQNKARAREAVQGKNRSTRQRSKRV